MRNAGFSLDGFNLEQKEALALCDTTAHGLVIIQGPPGTGKSHLIARGLAPLCVSGGGRVIIACLSNKAIDALALKIIAAAEDGRCGLLLGEIARLGYRTSVDSRVIDAEIYLDQEEAKTQLASKRVVLTTLHQLTKRCVARESDDSDAGWSFETFIVEEARFVEDSKIREGLAACEGGVRRLVLVGDQRQLQPIVKHDILQEQGYGRSCLERAIDVVKDRRDRGLVPFVMLKEQWRMAPDIRALVSALSYDGMLRDAARMDVTSRGGHDRAPLFGKSIIMINISFGMPQMVDNSKRNVEEANVVKAVYDQLKQRRDKLGLPPSIDAFADRLGIVSPYRAQNRAILAKLQGVDEDEVVGFADYNSSSALEPALDGGVDGLPSVGTAHQYQGSERDVIIMSACHLSAFAADLRLLNVKLSRAKHLLVIVGRLEQFAESNQHWRTIWQHRVHSHVINAGTLEDVKQKMAKLLGVHSY